MSLVWIDNKKAAVSTPDKYSCCVATLGKLFTHMRLRDYDSLARATENAGMENARLENTRPRNTGMENDRLAVH